MKTTFSVFLLASFNICFSQVTTTQNIFIVTTDGFRWQEVFNGADSSLINNPRYVSDTSLMKQLFWDDSPIERRKKLMPFFWNVIASHGQLYGNREFDNRVNVKNPYKISYPGYNELLTGFADPLTIRNTPTYNRNKNLLEYLNEKPEYDGHVAVFSSWYIFPFLLNTRRNHIPINSGYELMTETGSENAQKISEVQLSVENNSKTRYDLLTFLTAKEYIQSHHPKIVLLSFGETDEFAHQEKYDRYLQQANNVDRMIGELWYYIQTDTFYKNNTTLIITTDHGRGSRPSKWDAHGFFTKGSGEIWLALLGKSIEPSGEIKSHLVIWQNQIAPAVASLLNYSFKSLNKTNEQTQSSRAKSVLAFDEQNNNHLVSIKK